MSADADPPPVPWGELLRVFGRIGLINFGGPAAQIALMHKTLVDERRWLDEARYLHALNYCMMLPGPEALQVAIYAGWRARGVAGGIVAGLLFILPGFSVMMVLSILFALYHRVDLVAGLFTGIKAATLAVVIEALIRVARRALKTRVQRIIATLSFLTLFLAAAPYPVVVIGAALIGLLAAGPAAPQATRAEAPGQGPRGGAWTRALWLSVAAGALWLAPYLAIVVIHGPGSIFGDLMVFFGKLALVGFGGAYAMLAYVAEVAVQQRHWLDGDAMVAGLGLAETTPGPLVLVLCFVGFQAAHGLGGGIGAGLLGGAVAALSTFLPSFLWVLLGAPHLEGLRGRRRLDAALAGITGAVVGVIASLSLWFALHVLFRVVEPVDWGAARLQVPVPASIDPVACALALLAGGLILGAHQGVVRVLALCAILGGLASLVG